MAKNAAETIICVIFLSTVCLIFVVNKCVISWNILQDIDVSYSWIAHFIVNVLGYCTVVVPCYLVYKYVKKINYVDKVGSGFFPTLIRRCFTGDEELPDKTSSSSVPHTQLQEACLLMFYFFGLQMSFLSWGILQEKIMTQKYVNGENQEGHFKDSQFLVFVNRILAFVMSGIVVFCRRQPRHKCPLYKYIFCSMSNILSSWCQYEALKYVSFIHQVLAKAAKTIPVMIMGKIVSRTKYEYYEYVTAVVLSIGMLLFMVDAGNDSHRSTVTTFSGVVLLCSYIAFDSFTSNWQGALFKQFSMSPVQMMCAVNFFSCILTSTSLLQQDGFAKSVAFMTEFPAFVVDCVLLSVCSAAGQLFIFCTLATFGPLVFAIISTIRQGFSVLLSCIIYKHDLNTLGIFGIVMVFVSIFLRIYCSHRLRAIRTRLQNVPKN